MVWNISSSLLDDELNTSPMEEEAWLKTIVVEQRRNEKIYKKIKQEKMKNLFKKWKALKKKKKEPKWKGLELTKVKMKYKNKVGKVHL
jgi:hypothetical protein